MTQEQIRIQLDKLVRASGPCIVLNQLAEVCRLRAVDAPEPNDWERTAVHIGRARRAIYTGTPT